MTPLTGCKYLLLLCFLASYPLAGEVYMSGRSIHLDSATGLIRSVPGNWQKALMLEQLWKEEFFCNTLPHTLTGGITRGSSGEFIDALLLWTHQPTVTVAGDGVLLKWKEGEREHRLWWRPTTGNFPGLWFHLELSTNRDGKVLWPVALPHAGGITPVTVLEYPSRNGIFMDYTAPGMSAPVQFRQWTTVLYADGWESLSLEGNLPWAEGEMLINRSKGYIALLQTGDDGTGCIYIRKI